MGTHTRRTIGFSPRRCSLTFTLAKTYEAGRIRVESIAIIGIGCRFPGANCLEDFWYLLQNGVDAITEVPPDRWDIDAFYNPEPATSGTMNTRFGSFLEKVDQFDPGFFRISPREAERMDPQQRLILEVAWEALENAGLVPSQLAGSQTGVFIGISNCDYNVLLARNFAHTNAYNGTGNAWSIAANRLSYILDLRGPSIIMDTACSSSLVAVHFACQSLQTGESEICIVGGVNLILSPYPTIIFSQAGMMATDGRCKTFDAKADGYVRGEGCGVVVLKRLCDALRDKDNILAIIKGSAVNQDGFTNGLTAPNGLSQQAVIRQALKKAGVAPAQISYVEAHGTGTSLGDPLEIKALKAVLMEGRSLEQPCWIGSVKTNIGHLEAAAGIAGLIKVVLSLQHKEIPPHLHLQQLNSYISLKGTPFSIPTERQSWITGSESRLAGISSFGFGGTNCHVILEEPPAETSITSHIERPLHLLTLSAKSEQALKELAQSYGDFVVSHPEASLADICFTANVGRSHFNHRLAVVTESTTKLHEQLAAFTVGKQEPGVTYGIVERKNCSKIAFLFTGQGSQYPDMGCKLYKTQHTFRQALQQCDELLSPYLEQPLLKVLYGTPDTTHLLYETAYTQPALFALEYALAELWRSWGIVPDAVMGHSIGEYVAACVAGVFSLEDGLKLVVERSRLMQSLPQNGEMAAVFAQQEQVANILAQYEGQVAIAAINGPNNIVISGVRKSVQSALEQFQAQAITVKPLQVSHAFHSLLMERILDEFESKAARVQFQAPHIALISNLTGEMFKSAEVPDASYWRRHLREPVQFATGMNTLAEHSYEIFLEIGPCSTLLGMGKRCLPKTKSIWLPSLQLGQDDWQVFLNSLGVMETQGVEIDWVGYDRDYQRRRIFLPTYPFERKRYWFKSYNKKDVNLMDVNESDMQLSQLEINTTPQATQGHKSQSKLLAIVASLLQTDPNEIDIYASFLEMGADSLVLVEAIQTIKNTFGIKITIRQLFEELTTINALATYIDQNLSPEWVIKSCLQPKVQLEVPSQHLTISSSTDTTDVERMHEVLEKEDKISVTETALERIMVQQPQVMSQPMEVLHNNRLPSQKSPLRETALSKSLNHSEFNGNYPADVSLQSQKPINASSDTASFQAEPNKAKAKTVLPFLSVKPESNGGLSPKQQQHLEALIARYTKRTQKSKQLAQSYRSVLADSRATVGFRFRIKEMLYPIVGEHSVGSRLWDIDGNEYVDLTMGFGVHLFGHSPSFITEVIHNELNKGMLLGPRSSLAGEAAEIIRELTGMERVTFCNSGTEAVMVALRLARATTGRSKIALFAGSYHGHFDGILATAQIGDSKLCSVPIAPGVSQNTIEDVMVLEYGVPQSLKVLKAHAHELAAVLVEPVQSRRPDLQPQTFLQELRQLTQAAGTALIFDEVITGFRIHPGGAQAWFGVEADLVTYGKLIGGGMPIGVVAGKATYMDKIDGGAWSYGDSSYPKTERIFFGATFSMHPLAMAAARATLQHLIRQGPTLQEKLNQRTSQLAQTLNTYFEQNDMPIRMVHFGSLFRFASSANIDLFFYHLLEKGIYIWEWRNCFLSTAHTDEDINYIIQAVKDSVEKMRVGGFFSNLNCRTFPKSS